MFCVGERERYSETEREIKACQASEGGEEARIVRRIVLSGVESKRRASVSVGGRL